MSRNLPGKLSVLAIGLALAACKGVDSTLGSAQQSDGLAAGLPQADPVQDLRAYCPKTVMRAGTEKLDLYPPQPKKKNAEPPAPAELRFRATITEVARECNQAGEFLNMKVGIAGRVISGPAGETGTVLLPVRVAVTQGETVLYSQLHDIGAEILPGRTSANFSFVDAAISFPKPTAENIIVQVGFDEQRTDAPGDKQAKKPIN
jgi:hypothetical protein